MTRTRIIDERRPGRPTRERAAALADRILTGARHLFCEQGHTASMDDIAAAVGVSKLTIYRRFPSKEALLYAVVDHDLHRLASQIETPPDHPEDALTALCRSAYALFAFSIEPENVRFAQLLMHEAFGTPEIGQRAARWESLMRAPLVSRIAEAQRAGALGAGDAASLAMVLVDLMDGFGKRLRSNTLAAVSDADADRFFEERWHFFLRAAT